MKKFSQANILAIDTSCDETSVAVLSGRKVLSSVVASQTDLHKKWGGVVPDVARRAHQENILSTYYEAIKRSEISIKNIDAVAVTIGPGLAIDLEVGIEFAQEICMKEGKPLIPVNHMEGHLLSGILLNSRGRGGYEGDPEELLPALGMLISGKHTEIIKVEQYGVYEKLGQTLDDAAGEAFDKVGRILGFGYPGGPLISEFAKRASRKESFGLPIPMDKSGDLNFSYSGLKTACLYKVNSMREEGRQDKDWINDFCAEFVDVVTESIVRKVEKALEENPETKTLFTGGGVYNNEYLVRKISSSVRSTGRRILIPEIRFRSDNAGMIGIAGLRMYGDGLYLSSKTQIEKVERIPRYSIVDLPRPIELI